MQDAATTIIIPPVIPNWRFVGCGSWWGLPYGTFEHPRYENLYYRRTFFF